MVYFKIKPGKKINTKSNSSLLNELATRMSYYSSVTDLYLPDPDIVLNKLGIGLDAYRELLSDAHVGACIESRKAGVKSLNWEITPNESAEQSEFIENIFNSLKIDSIINELLNAPLFGFQPIELMWRNIDGQIIPESIIGKPPEWFCFGNNNELRFKPEDSQEGEELPEGKFLAAVHDASYTNPYGTKILSKCYWPVTFKKGGLKFWAMFVERFSGAFAVGKYPRGAQKEEIDGLADMLENLVQSAVAAIPDDSSVEIIEAGGKGASSEIYKSYCEFLNTEISKAIVGQTLTTEIGSSGSYAAGKIHAEVRADIVASDARLVTDVFNQLIALICKYNFNLKDSLPTFNFWSEKDIDKNQAERDAILLNTEGFRFTKSYWQKTYGFDDKDIEIIQGYSPMPTFFSKKPSLSQPKDELDNLIDTMTIKDIENEMNGVLNPVIKLIQETDDYNVAMEKLVATYDTMTSDELASMLERAIFVAGVYARLKGEKENA